MADLEHFLAIYYDEDCNRKIIYASELKDVKIYEKAQKIELFDGSEQIKLAVRTSSNGTPHFYSSGRGVRTVFDGERDETHDTIVNNICDSLKAFSNWSLRLVDDVTLLEEITLPKYEWAPEVHRILNEDVVVRHDIFGQSSEIAMSTRRPWVAIEVIHTHYPEAQAFSALLEASRQIPLIVFFVFSIRPQSWILANSKTNILRYRPWTFYIKDGNLYKGAKKTEITTPTAFQKAAELTLKKWRSEDEKKN